MVFRFRVFSFCIWHTETEQKRMCHTISCSGYLNIMPGCWGNMLCVSREYGKSLSSEKKWNCALSIWHSNQVAIFCSGWSKQLWRELDRNLGECTFRLHCFFNDTGQNLANLSQLQELRDIQKKKYSSITKWYWVLCYFLYTLNFCIRLTLSLRLTMSLI